MTFWPSLIGYQLVWFAAVIGASRGVASPGVAAMLAAVVCQLALARRWKADLSLLVAAVVCGWLLDGGLIHWQLVRYAAPWPSAALPPAWILALWIAFALTFTQSLAWLQTRLWRAALLGLIGGPLAYLGASRGWRVVTFTDPAWHALLGLGLSWAAATPALAWLARRCSARKPPSLVSLRGRPS